MLRRPALCASTLLLALAVAGGCTAGAPPVTPPTTVPDAGAAVTPPTGPTYPLPCIDVDGDGFGAHCAAGPDCDDFDALRAGSCGAPAAGLAPPLPALPVCDDGAQRDCYGEPVPGPTPLDATCAHGLSLCVHGAWAACAIDAHFTIPRAAITGAIITGPSTCNPCDPACFTSGDYPTGTDLTAMNSMGVVYVPASGGISLPAGMGGMGGLTDTDGDGVPDVADTYPGDPTRDGTREAGGFYHTLPMGTTAPPDTLMINTMVRTADVYFLMDTTGSMGGEISNLKSTLSSTIIPNILTTIPDAWFGVGHHDDLPCCGYGSAGLSTSPLHHDWGYENMLDLQASTAAAQTSVNTLNLGYGNDFPESQVPALWAVATGGALYGSAGARGACPTAGRFGYPCFRAGTIPVIILFTDAAYHNGPGGYDPYGVAAPTYATTVSALNAIGAKVIVVYSGDTSVTCVSSVCSATCCGWLGCSCCGYTCTAYADADGLAHAKQIAAATGAVDTSGTPFVYTINPDGSGLSTAVSSAISTLANYSRMNITLRVNDNVATAGVDERNFVTSITALSTGSAPTRCTAIHSNWFEQCLPGTNVQFSVTLGNGFVAPTAVPQVFRFTIDELGDGTYILGTTPVTIVVPPSAPMYPASGTYWRDYDSTTVCSGTDVPRWGTLTWTATYPAGTDITWQLQTAPTAAGLAAAPIVSFVAPATASPVNVGDRLFMGGQSPTMPFLRVTTVLHSSADRLRAPVLSGFDLTFACIPGM